jgi:glutathione S-transferase
MPISIYYHPLCPFSKQISVLALELGHKCNFIKEDYWKGSAHFLDLSPWGELPVIVLNDSQIIAGTYPTLEYFFDTNSDSHLFHRDLLVVARIRQIINWVNKHLYNDVTTYILHEKLIKIGLKNQYPDTMTLRYARHKLTYHLRQIQTIIALQGYLAYENLSIADISCASHIAVLDYFGEINWDSYPKIKKWYCLIKSRPHFRSTLQEKINNIRPPEHYLDLDF